jgi:hypothetical protein
VVPLSDQAIDLLTGFLVEARLGMGVPGPRTSYARKVVELCLSHVHGDPLERAYQRGDIIEKRRRLMQE